jgi:hypothetical protein
VLQFIVVLKRSTKLGKKRKAESEKLNDKLKEKDERRNLPAGRQG